MEDREIVNGKIVIKEPGFECPAIVLSVLFWIAALAWWLSNIYK
jgi:hypothetical protein